MVTRNRIFALIGLAALGAIVFQIVDKEPPAFPTLIGPATTDVIPQSPPPRTSPELYFTASNSGIAILLQDIDASWLGLAHGLKSIGVPFRVVQSIEQALEHDVILVYPTLTGSNTAPAALAALAQHVRDGKTLIAFSVIGGGMPALFGFETTSERNDLLEMNFDTAALAANSIAAPEATRIRLAALQNPIPMPGVSYHELKHLAIATYNDGSAAISHNVYAAGDKTGHAYAIGFDFGHFILRAQNFRFNNFVETYANSYQPIVDSLLRFLADVYVQSSPDAVEILTTPFNFEFTALMTHDIDFVDSLINTVDYANYEREQNISATYFIQTKYTTDYNEARFFDESRRGIIETLYGLDMELASHSVAHSNAFQSMELGTGRETYPDYQPFVQDFERVRDANIAGELRISKFLLESLADQPVISFRPGYLSLPESLPQMLEATGYKYSSSITANQAQTHLPYRTNFQRSYDTETSIFEFPVTIEDEIGRLGDRLPEAIEVANKIAVHGGLVNVLIHTDVLDHKLAFAKGFVAEFRDRAWFSSVGAFGDWWSVRESAVVAVEDLAGGKKRLTISVDGEIDGLSLRVPGTWVYESGLSGTAQDEDVIVLGILSGSAGLVFGIGGGNN